MRVLVVHNAYQHRGGEDSVVESEVALLRQHGHEVQTYGRSNDDIHGLPQLTLARQTLWSDRTTADVAVLVESFRPDVIHVHNTFPLVSPSLYWAAARLRVPVVQTLHNFRLMCLGALYLRDGKVCEDCAGKLPWRGVARACYRGSKPASAVLGGMLMLHRAMGTYQQKVTRYIALNEFCRRKFVEGGLPAERVLIKPNFVDAAATAAGPRSGLLYVGRLSAEKGIGTLAHAAPLVPQLRLSVAGEGNEASLLEGLAGVERLGNLSGPDVRQQMEKAVALVVPSIWYENFPRTIVEAFAAGLPVVASRIGALADIVSDGKTGLLFEPGNPDDLADKLRWVMAHPDEMAKMGGTARAEFERLYTPQANYQRLMEIYGEAIQATA